MAGQAYLSIAAAVGGIVGCAGFFVPVWAANVAATPGISAAGSRLERRVIAQVQSNQGYQIIHVNAKAGSDAQGTGNQLRPLKTITHALRVAQPNTLILLAEGVYTQETGEVFPLQLRSGITVQGAAGPNAAAVAIVGTGRYLSAARGLQNVTILGADNAGLANVTVSNPQPGGTGLWIESGSPIILDNAFYRSGATGIYIAGRGTAVIRNNYFSENRQAGLVIAGASSPQVEGNIFENTGTGISVAPEASPQILNNRITRNRQGLVIHAEARPLLQNNQIRQNRHNSILDYAAWENRTSASEQQAIPSPPPRIAATSATQVTEPPVTPLTVAPPERPNLSQGEPPAELPAASPLRLSTLDAEEMTASAPSEAPLSIREELTEELTHDSILESSDVSHSADTVETAVTSTESAPVPITPVAAVSEQLALPREQASSQPIALRQSETSPPDDMPDIPEAAAVELTHEQDSPSDIAVAVEPDAVAVDEAIEADAVAVDEAIEADAVEADAAAASESLLARLLHNRRQRQNQAAALSEIATNEALPEVPEPIEIPVISPLVDTELDTSESGSHLPESVAVSTSSGEGGDALGQIGDIPELPSRANSAASIGSDRIRVPNLDIPTGRGGNLPNAYTGGAVTVNGSGPPPPPSLASALGLAYRVFVETGNAAEQAALRQQVPDAFQVRVNGRAFMQTGAYKTFEEAQEMAEWLNQVGFRAQIEQIP